MRIGPIGIINRAFPSMFSRTSGVPGKRGCLVLPDFPDQVTFQNFPEKHLEETGATSAPWETFGGRGLREPTEPVSVADFLGPAPHGNSRRARRWPSWIQCWYVAGARCPYLLGSLPSLSGAPCGRWWYAGGRVFTLSPLPLDLGALAWVHSQPII